MNTAEEEGLVQRHIDGKTFGPGRRLRKIAANTLSSERMRTERLAILNILAEAVGETCNISVPGRTGMVYLERVETEWPLRIQLAEGTRVPFHCTASGKMYLSSLAPNHLDRYLNATDLTARTENTITDRAALLAELKDIAQNGFSIDRAEFMEDMIAVAVPILETNGRLMATLSVHAPKQRFDSDRALHHLDGLRAAASELSQLIEGDD